MIRCRRGQSTVEYLLLVVIVIGAFIVVAKDNNGLLNKAVTNLFTRSSNWLNSVANSLP